jgi:hypothetical protein
VKKGVKYIAIFSQGESRTSGIEVLNVGNHTFSYKKLSDRWEGGIQVNILSTTLLALLVPPWMRNVEKLGQVQPLFFVESVWLETRCKRKGRQKGQKSLDCNNKGHGTREVWLRSTLNRVPRIFGVHLKGRRYRDGNGSCNLELVTCNFQVSILQPSRLLRGQNFGRNRIPFSVNILGLPS